MDSIARLALALLLAATTARGELVDSGRYSSKEECLRQRDESDPRLLNRYVNKRFTDSGALRATGHFIVRGESIEWHLADTPYRLNFVIVEEGYASYRLYSVSDDEVKDSGEPQYVGEIGGWNFIPKGRRDVSKGDFKGDTPIGEVLFYGSANEFNVFSGFGENAGGPFFAGGGGPGPGGGGGVTPAPTVCPSMPPCCATPTPCPSPHNVPESGSTFLFLLCALALLATVRLIRLIAFCLRAPFENDSTRERGGPDKKQRMLNAPVRRAHFLK